MKPVYDINGTMLGNAESMYQAKMMLKAHCPEELNAFNAGVEIGDGFYEACFYTAEMPKDLKNKYGLGVK